ncbi:6811_t:CDS:2 [Funneliformis geosporum]|uniref:6811_t:CDS:1 n=1 Tax=Funneliformis geosporum TaxID=1117311 RepID=A0A9W4SBR3_9GLOM|nr:6811_t:CDS:2 [Funneliformis geosporum]
MTYTAEELERQFQQVAGIRKGKKEFERDGASHNLKEDCKRLSDAFNKLESFGRIREELQACTSKSEYDAKKTNYIRNGKGNKENVESKAKTTQKNLQQLKKSLEKEDYK